MPEPWLPIGVAALQMVSGQKLDDNLQSAQALVATAAKKGAKLAVLPENFALFGSKKIFTLATDEARDGAIQHFLSNLASDYGITLVGGSIPLPSPDGRVFACSFVYGADGSCLGCYRKIHLFDADVGDAQGSYRESDSYAPGENILVVDSAVGRIGVGICYDLRFPEMFRRMLDQQAEIIVLPSAFTRSTGWAHWLPLLRARAIENQCLVVAANQGGIHDAKRQTSGGSVVIDSWGSVLAEAGLGEACVIAKYDREEQRALRQRMPVSQHRRL
ncbi:Deaminated glutathione amidase [Zhongshania aliphaticivorans]|uniref:Deaminated glutathione amidase n=1 Tax=Zhongshania aliphaticivorans TaxID=1470434 RepID=A0A5S9N364_9GAMM|nr:carbon-nitrogen hydrolase family protein [Zhongshania aliphaticivorans]CAA0083312.1 Deaminated glutathione amidase [Zhongshania aliphaticivorans]CAA0083466.1 Deaminated glutathione amidase [Zhongshania aliphaticivorans]